MKTYSILLLTMAIMVLTGCSNDDDARTLTLSSETLVLGTDITEQTISVKSDASWNVRSNVQWCKPIKNNGKGNDDIVLWVSPNLTQTPRQGTLTVSTGNLTRTVKLSQPAYTGSLDDYVYRLPVMFHVLYNDKEDEQQYVKEGHLAKILTGVNKLYDSNHMNVEFEMARYDDKGNLLDEPGVMRHEVSFTDYLPEDFLRSDNQDNRQYADYAQNLRRYINIYIFQFKEESKEHVTMGLSNLPVMPTAHPLDSLYTTDQANGYSYLTAPWGCLINNQYIYEWQEANTYNPNYIVNTVAHELGHYLGLLHTFSAEECEMDDACDDTHISDYTNYVSYISEYIKQQTALGIKTFKMADLAVRKDCKTLEEYQAHNIMDYAYCFNDEFSHQQFLRTRQVLQYSPLVPGPKLVEYTITRSVNIAPLRAKTSGCPTTLRHFPVSPI